MRFVVALVGLIAAAPALAEVDVALPKIDMPDFDFPSFEIPHLQLTTGLFDIGKITPAATPSIIVPPRYGWILDDGRAFWFAAGASAVVSLGTHVLVGIPTAAFAAAGYDGISRASPASVIPFLVGVGGVYMLGQAALSALAAVLVFNNVSKVYDANYLVALAGQVAGSLLGAGVSALSFGVGLALVQGLGGLVEFTGSAGVGAIYVFSVLGALPALVIGGICLIGVPALVGAWAMSVSATAKEGYSVNPMWKEPLGETSSTTFSQPILTIPLPG